MVTGRIVKISSVSPIANVKATNMMGMEIAAVFVVPIKSMLVGGKQGRHT